MKVLAVDTTTERESVAVAAEGELLGEVRLRSDVLHSRRLMPAIAYLLAGLGIAPGEVEGYAVTLGPGSFTGLRVGLSCVQGLALASGRPCLGVSALDVLGARGRGTAPHVVALVDGGRGEVYGAIYGPGGTTAGARAAPLAEVLRDVPAGAAFVGSGAERHREAILALVEGPLFPDRSPWLAGTLARMAEPELAAGRGVAPSELRPLYLRAPHIRAARG